LGTNAGDYLKTSGGSSRLSKIQQARSPAMALIECAIAVQKLWVQMGIPLM
jgi:hypothetical protein